VKCIEWPNQRENRVQFALGLEEGGNRELLLNGCRVPVLVDENILETGNGKKISHTHTHTHTHKTRHGGTYL
jgi:hypothetical protein